MGKCETNEVCSFFNNKLKAMPSISMQLKKKYCENDKDSCARYLIKLKLRQGYYFEDEEAMKIMESSLVSMYPNDHEKAETIIGLMVR